MANSSSVQPWTLTMPLGSLQQWLFTLTTIDTFNGQSEPYPITGATWEYVARTSATDDGTPVIDLTTTPGANGVLVVTDTSALSSVQVDIYPAATQGVTPGTLYHALWMNPSTSSAFCFFSGTLIVQGNPQP